MKALSIRQPWAWLIIRPDIIGDESRAAAVKSGEIKTIENRSRRCLKRERIFIHASAGITRAEYADAADWLQETFGTTFNLPAFEKLECGGIVGSADITDCIAESCNHWFVGPFGWVLANARPETFKPCKGALNFFEVEL
jgi:hypothetical protein